MIELEHFCDRADIGTIFEDLRVLDLRTAADLIGRRDRIDQSWKRIVVAVQIPRIAKSDGTPDRRYDGWWKEDDAKLWPLLGFIDRLSRIAEEGDMTDPLHQWKDRTFRPAQVQNGMVLLLDWPVLPIYRTGGFSGFLQNLVILLEAAKELMQEATSR